jgi:5-methyltetrahydrofolate--homocysteine methyltransferase
MPPIPLLAQISQAIIDLMPKKTAELTQAALDAGLAPKAILLEGLAAGMKRVGELFAAKEFFVPEVLLASRAMDSGFALVKPLVKSGAVPRRGKVVIGVVQGDIHDIGKNIVKVLLEADGFELVDLGKDVPVERFVRAVAEQKGDMTGSASDPDRVPRLFVGLSSLMTTTMPVMGDVITALDKSGLREHVRVIVGGAPLTADYARSIGADGYAADAPAAVQEFRNLLGT